MDNTTENGLTIGHKEISSVSLARVTYSKDDPRTHEQKAEGELWINNEGLLGIELDKKALVVLLTTEGLSPQEISDLILIFAARRIVDVDLSGSPIGGLHRGNEIIVFTTGPVIVHRGETPPELLKDRFVNYQNAYPPEMVVDTLLHELKHFSQSKKGVEMPSSWAAETMEEHDNLPTEKEAIEFAKAHASEFLDRIKITDDQGVFKKAQTVIPTGGEVYVTGLVSEERVARFMEDSSLTNRAYEYIHEFENLISGQRLRQDLLPDFIARGQQLIRDGAISEYELGYMLDRIKEKV